MSSSSTSDLSSCSHGQVLIVGGSKVDISVWPTMTGGASCSVGAGGKGLNQAVAASRLGRATVAFASVCSHDWASLFAKRSVEHENVKAYWRVIADASLGVVAAVVQDDSRTEVEFPPRDNTTDLRAAADVLSADLIADLRSVMDVATSVGVTCDFGASTTAAVVELATAARRPSDHGGHWPLVVVNAAPVSDFGALLGRLPLIDWLVANEVEAHRLLGPIDEPESCLDAAAQIRALGARNVCVTKGRDGVAVAHEDGTVEALRAFHATAVDGTGAGDAFCAAIMVAMSEGRTSRWALRFARAAGALATSKRGGADAMPHRSDVERLMRSAPAP